MVVLVLRDIKFWTALSPLVSGLFRHSSSDICRSLLSRFAFLTRCFAIFTADSDLPLLWLCNGKLVMCWNSFSRANLANFVLEYWGPLSVTMSTIPWQAKWRLVVLITYSHEVVYLVTNLAQNNRCSSPQSLNSSHYSQWRDLVQPLTKDFRESCASSVVISVAWLGSHCILHNVVLDP